MANVDLSTYNLRDLKNLQGEVEQAIKDRQQQDVQKARDQILAIAKEAGVSVEELFAASSNKSSNKGGKQAGQKVKPQYQNPQNAAQTWTGRGRQPKWIAEGLQGGKTLDDFRM